MGLFKNIGQWLANRSVTIEYKGRLEADLVQHDLARLNTKLTARIDALEMYVSDVMEKFLKREKTREARAQMKEPPMVVEPMTAFDSIRGKYGGAQ